jgi:hypothetical protein
MTWSMLTSHRPVIGCQNSRTANRSPTRDQRAGIYPERGLTNFGVNAGRLLVCQQSGSFDVGAQEILPSESGMNANDN